jgi:hypothetical protein
MSIDQFLLSADTTDLNYPEIRPTLDLNFARVKALDPRITFTRASGGSYVGADGLIKYAGVNEARFDHDPETGESLGLLIEESRSNLLTWSEDFSDSSWFKDNINIQSGYLAPDGTLSATWVQENSSTSLHRLQATILGITGSTSYCRSVYVKSDGSDRNVLIQTDGFVNWEDPGSLVFNPKTGTVVLSTVDNYGVIPVVNGWYRIWISSSTTSSPNSTLNFELELNKAAQDYTGDGYSGAYFWGAQFEVGSFPTSYIPTQASTRTRSTESAAITGKKFSSFYNQSEGTIFSTTKSILPTGNNGIIWSMDNTSTDTEEKTELFRVPTNYRVRMRPSSGIDTIFANIVFSDQDLNNFNNCIVSYKRDDSTTFSNAISTFIVSRGEIPILNRLRFSSSGSQVKWISVFRYWPKRIPNIQIRLLTSN